MKLICVLIFFSMTFINKSNVNASTFDLNLSSLFVILYWKVVKYLHIVYILGLIK